MHKLVIYRPRFGAQPGGRRLQQAAIDKYTKPADRQVIADFEETRPGLVELQKAMTKASEAEAMLVFSKVGYLSRNLKFLRALAEGGANLQFVALDDKKFNPRTFQVYLTQAKEVWHKRRDLIKDRMNEEKMNGAKYGSARRGAQTKNWRAAEPWNAAAKASVEARTERVNAAYATLIPEMQRMRAKQMSFAEIATNLNEAGHLTTTNAPFSAATVFKILKRLERQGGQSAAKGRKGLGRKAHAGTVR
jgi:hypothetical protein